MNNSNLMKFDDSTEIFPGKITVKAFLEHTAPAVKAIFEAIIKEEARYAPIKHLHNSTEQAHRKAFEHSDFNDDVDPSRAQFHFIKAAEAKKQAFLISQSIGVLSGAILQIAKQGMSLIHEIKKPPKKGKLIGRQFLSSVIWQGRNQAMHWENGFSEELPHAYTKRCFEALATDCGPQFKVNQPLRNMAWDICKIIDWSSYENYEKDMKEILEVKNGDVNLSIPYETI